MVNGSPIAVFNHVKFGDIRIVDNDGEQWFVAKDVAAALGYSKTRNAVAAHCKGGEFTPLSTSGGEQSLRVIPESDVYRLVMRSKLPTAEQFRGWLTNCVLPQVRSSPTASRPVAVVSDARFGDAYVGEFDVSKFTVRNVLGCRDLPEYSSDDGVCDGLSFSKVSALVEQSSDPVAEPFLVWLSQCRIKPRKGVSPFERICQIGRGLKFPEHAFVYAIVSKEKGCTKFGFSKSPVSRLRSVRAHIPDAMLSAKWFVKRPRYVESLLHHEFSAERSHNEWFQGCDLIGRAKRVVDGTNLKRSMPRIKSLLNRFGRSQSETEAI